MDSVTILLGDRHRVILDESGAIFQYHAKRSGWQLQTGLSVEELEKLCWAWKELKILRDESTETQKDETT